MTPDQQESAFDNDNAIDEDTLYFETDAEYMTWKASHDGPG